MNICSKSGNIFPLKTQETSTIKNSNIASINSEAEKPAAGFSLLLVGLVSPVLRLVPDRAFGR
jgi:hypothetical protein